MRKISLAALALSCAFNLAAQNSLWVCVPKKIQGTSSVSDLPTGPSSNNPYDPYDYYDGWSAKHGSNGILDVNGNLHFFIVDGAIYNSTGAYVAYAWGAGNPPTMSVGNVTQPKGDGGSEQIIIPHPVNCNQYYIFGILTENNIENGVKTGEAATSRAPAYCL